MVSAVWRITRLHSHKQRRVKRRKYYPPDLECALFLVSSLIPYRHKVVSFSTLIPHQHKVSLHPVVSFLSRPSHWQVRPWGQVDSGQLSRKWKQEGFAQHRVGGGAEATVVKTGCKNNPGSRSCSESEDSPGGSSYKFFRGKK